MKGRSKAKRNTGSQLEDASGKLPFPPKMQQCQIWMLILKPRGFLQTVDWEDTRQERRGTNTHWCLSLVCFCLLETPLKMYISPLPIASLKLPYLRTHTKTVFIASASIFSSTFTDCSAWLLNKMRLNRRTVCYCTDHFFP